MSSFEDLVILDELNKLAKGTHKLEQTFAQYFGSGHMKKSFVLSSGFEYINQDETITDNLKQTEAKNDKLHSDADRKRPRTIKGATNATLDGIVSRKKFRADPPANELPLDTTLVNSDAEAVDFPPDPVVRHAKNTLDQFSRPDEYVDISSTVEDTRPCLPLHDLPWYQAELLMAASTGLEDEHALLMRDLEVKYMPEREGLLQSRITPRMRMILVDWMIEVCDEYGLQRDTLYEALNFTDRFVSIVGDVGKNKLQLVGVTSLFVASKLQEIYAPKVPEFAAVTDDSYNCTQIANMEALLLQKLDWYLAPVTVLQFVRLYLRRMTRRLAEESHDTGVDHFMYRNNDRLTGNAIVTGGDYARFPGAIYGHICAFLDIALCDIRYALFLPSIMAAAALLLVQPNDELLLEVSDFSLEDILPCARWLHHYAALPLDPEGYLRNHDMCEKALEGCEWVTCDHEHYVHHNPQTLELATEHQNVTLDPSQNPLDLRFKELTLYFDHWLAPIDSEVASTGMDTTSDKKENTMTVRDRYRATPAPQSASELASTCVMIGDIVDPPTSTSTVTNYSMPICSETLSQQSPRFLSRSSALPSGSFGFGLTRESSR